VHLFKIGQIEHNAAPPESFTASWPANLRLISATINSEAGVPVLNLAWHIGTALDPNMTVFVHVQDADRQLVGQADGDLVGGYVPIGLWSPNDRVQDRRPLLAADQLAPGRYTVIVGLYDRRTQQRLNPVQSNQPVKDDALIVGEFEWP
jgi:hypothetical protein